MYVSPEPTERKLCLILLLETLKIWCEADKLLNKASRPKHLVTMSYFLFFLFGSRKNIHGFCKFSSNPFQFENLHQILLKFRRTSQQCLTEESFLQGGIFKKLRFYIISGKAIKPLRCR